MGHKKYSDDYNQTFTNKSNLAIKQLGVDMLLVIYKALCFDVTQGRMNWAPNENQTHSCRFASQAC